MKRTIDMMTAARALIAADPALRSACERAADYNEKENPHV